MAVWLVFIAFVALAAFVALKGLRKTFRGEGCSNCSGCSSRSSCSFIVAPSGESSPSSDEERNSQEQASEVKLSEGNDVTMTLDEIKPGGRATVLRNRASGAVKQRMMDMGFHKGVALEVVRNAPLVDPVEFLLDGQHVSLRHAEARLIEVEIP